MSNAAHKKRHTKKPRDTYGRLNASESRKAIAVWELAWGAKLEDAARAAGVSLRTIYTWRQDRHFRASVRMSQADLLRDATVELRAAFVEAVRTVRELMADRETPARVRGSLARNLITMFRPVGTFREKLEEVRDEVATYESGYVPYERCVPVDSEDDSEE